MAEGASRAIEDMEFHKVWDERDRLIGRLIEMEAEYEETTRALAEGKARLRELKRRLQKENGAPSEVHVEDNEATSEVYVEPPLKLSAQLRTRA